MVTIHTVSPAQILLPIFFASGLMAASPDNWRKEVYVPQDAGLIDITRPPYNAKGDSSTDNTQIILNAVADNINRHRTLYFPAGVYMISDTIDWRNHEGVFYSQLAWQGAGRSNTTIRLKDNAPVFSNPASPHAMIRPGSNDTKGNGGGNRAHNIYIFDMSFDVGKGNPGAIGVDFIASNNGAMVNVDIVSHDVGFCGLSMTRGVGPCLVKNCTVSGFDKGIVVGVGYGITFENIVLKDQKLIGFEQTGNVTAIRNLTSFNTVTALRNTVWHGMMTVVNASLSGGAPTVPAVQIKGGTVILRNVTIDGYTTAVDSVGKSIVKHHIDRMEPTPVTLFDGISDTFSIAAPETPEYENNNLQDWANIADYGDHLQRTSDAVQAACNSGKPVVYFPQGSYTLTTPVRVGESVKRIIGYHSYLLNGSVISCEKRSSPLIIERFKFADGSGIENAASAPLVLRYSVGHTYMSTPRTTEWFLEDVCCNNLTVTAGQHVYARQLNIESPLPGPHLGNAGGTVWVLGYKTENDNTVLRARNGGTTEILGALVYPAQGVKDLTTPMVENDNSAVSISLFEMVRSAGNTYRIKIRETRDPETRDLTKEISNNHYIVPLYRSTTGNLTTRVLRHSHRMNPVEEAYRDERGSSLLIYDVKGVSLGDLESSRRILGERSSGVFILSGGPNSNAHRKVFRKTRY